MKTRKTIWGFSEIEIAVTLAIAALLIALATPSLAQLIRNNRVSAVTNDLVAALQAARAEAARRGYPVTVCASADQTACSGTDNWSAGWLVFQDSATAGSPSLPSPQTQIIRVYGGSYKGMSLSGASGLSYLRFHASGRVDNGDSLGGALSIIPEGCSGEQRRQIDIASAGRISVRREACA